MLGDKYLASDVGFPQASRSVVEMLTDKRTVGLVGGNEGHTSALKCEGKYFSCQPTISER